MKRISDDRFKGALMKLEQTIDDNDRPVETWVKKRDIFFSELGIKANDQVLASQAKTGLDRKISLRMDNDLMLDSVNFRIQIGALNYSIERVYTDVLNERMELSLAYVK